MERPPRSTVEGKKKRYRAVCTVCYSLCKNKVGGNTDIFVCALDFQHCWGVPPSLHFLCTHVCALVYFQKWENTAQSVLYLTYETYLYILLFYQHM